MEYSVQFSSVAQSFLTLCNPMACSRPGLPVHHQLPEFTQTHVHWVGDAIQPSHPLLSPSPPAFNLSQNQGLFKESALGHKKEHIWVSSNEVDEPRAYYIEWSKSEREKQLLYINAYIGNLERWHWWAYLQGNSGDAGVENNLWTQWAKERVGQTERAALKHVYCILPCVR